MAIPEVEAFYKDEVDLFIFMGYDSIFESMSSSK